MTLVLTVNENVHFLENALLVLAIFYVFQKFYNLRVYVRVRPDTVLNISSLLLWGQVLLIACAMKGV